MALARTHLSGGVVGVEDYYVFGAFSLSETNTQGGPVTVSLVQLDSVDSTNDWMSRTASELATGTLVYTFNQTAGKGRHGRVWESKNGDTVAFSLLLDALPVGIHPTWVPLLAGVSVVDVVRGLGVTDASLKWPNDVLVRDLKLAGILVEALPDSRLVVGVGVNISSTEASLPHPGATSLALEGVSISDIEADFLTPIAEGLLSVPALGGEKNPSEAHSLWKAVVTQHLSTLDRVISWTGTDGRQQRGLAQELADDGALVVQGLLGYDNAVIRSGDIFHIERS